MTVYLHNSTWPCGENVTFHLHLSGLQYYREALLHCDTDCTARLALAELLLVSGEAEQSEEECMAILRAQPTHQGAGMVGVSHVHVAPPLDY